MIKTCIKCGKNIDPYRNSAQARCSYCGYDFLKEEFVTIFPFENISHIHKTSLVHKNFVFAQEPPFQPVAVRPSTVVENEKAKELSKLCITIDAVVGTNPSGNKNKELIRLCQCINAIVADTYKEALSKIPISEIFDIGMRIRNGAIPINEVVKMIPIGELKRLINKYENYYG